MNITASTILDISSHSKNEPVSTICFHPVDSVVAVSFGSTLNVYEIDGGFLVGSINSRKRITHVSLSMEVIIIVDDSGALQIWDYTNFTMIGIIDVSVSEKPIASLISSPCSHYICFSRVGSKTIFVHDISKKGISKPTSKFDCKRPVTSISFHPTESIVVAYCDGVVKIVDCSSGAVIAQSDELLKLCTVNNKTTAKGFVSFDSTGSYVAALNEKGLVVVFSYSDKQLTLESNGIDDSTFVGLSFHPIYPIFFTLSNEGILVARDLNCSVYGGFKLAAINELEGIERRYKLPRYARSLDEKFTTSQILFHQKYNYLSFFSSSNNVNYKQIVYSITDLENTSIPIHCHLEIKQSHQSLSLIRPTLKFPNHVFYLHTDGNIYEYNFHTSIQAVKFNLKELVVSPVDLREILGSPQDSNIIDERKEEFYPIKYSYSQVDNRHLVLLQRHTPGTGLYSARYCETYMTILSNEPHIPKLVQDAIISNEETGEIIALLPDRQTIDVISLGSFNIGGFAERIFPSSPLFKKSLIYQQDRDLIISSNCLDIDQKLEWYQMNHRYKLQLRPLEKVLQIQWNSPKDKLNYYGAILTTCRVLIVDSKLGIISSAFSTSKSLVPKFYSIYWMDNCLFFNSNTHIYYLTLGGNVHTLCEMNHPNSVIACILSDRLIYVTYEGSDFKVIVKAVGLLEPLVLSQLENPFSTVDNNNNNVENRHSFSEIGYLVSKFDCKRITSNLVNSFEKNGYFNYALELGKYLPFLSIEQKFALSLSSLDFQTAYSFLTEPFLYDRNYPTPNSTLNKSTSTSNNSIKPPTSNDNLIDSGSQDLNIIDKSDSDSSYSTNIEIVIQEANDSNNSIPNSQSSNIVMNENNNNDSSSGNELKVTVEEKKLKRAMSNSALLRITSGVIPHTHPFFQLFKELANISVKFGQFKIALSCYEKIEDYYSIVRLYAIHGQTTALQHLTKFFQSQSLTHGLSSLPSIISPNTTPNRFSELLSTTKRLLKYKSLLSSKETLPILNLEFSKIIPCVDSSPISLLSFITPREILNIYQYQFTICLGFLDRLEKWFPVASNELADLFFSSLNQQNDNNNNGGKRTIPSSPSHIIPMFVSWFREFHKKVSESNSSLKRPSNKIEPAHIEKLLNRRDGYLVSFSSTLKKYKLANTQLILKPLNNSSITPIILSPNSPMTLTPLMKQTSLDFTLGCETPNSNSDSESNSNLKKEYNEKDESSDLSDFSSDSLADSTGNINKENNSSNNESSSEEKDVNEIDHDNETKKEEDKKVITQALKSESGHHIVLKSYETSIPPPLSSSPLSGSPLSKIQTPQPRKSRFLSTSVAKKFENTQIAKKKLSKKGKSNLRSTLNISSSSCLFDSISGSVKVMRKSSQAPQPKVPLQIIEESQFALAKRRKENAIVLLENGFLSNSLAEMEEAIYLLSKFTNEPKQKEMKLCVKYKLALKLLILCKSFDFSNEKFLVAKLCSIIATIPLEPAHRLALCAIAAEKNFLCENYGICSQFFKMTLRYKVESFPQIESILQQCEEKGLSNKMEFAEYKRPFFCYQTFSDITAKSYYLCNFCDAKFSVTAKMADEQCNYCSVGKLEKKPLPA